MPSSGHNEADTRAKLIDPALHAARWVERVLDAERASHGEIQREQSAVRVEIVDGKPFKRGRGRVDYLLRAFVGDHEQPLTLAFVEAKKEKLPPTRGLEQVKAYARRFAVKFVYSTNGHQFVEYDTHTGQTTEPRPDRDELREQAHGRFHNVFGADAKIVREAPDGSNEARNARIHVATYQSLGIHEQGDAAFLRRHYPEDHFSHIIIDECHRSAWGTWSEVLKRNAGAFQVGLTATPRELTVTKADAEITADNLHHFGEPVYEYSLAQGIEDGYLAPCDIKQGRVDSSHSPKVVQMVDAMQDCDLFDVLAALGYGAKARTRIDRHLAFKFKNEDWLDNDMPSTAKAVILGLTGQFERLGTDALENPQIWRVPSIERAGGMEAQAKFPFKTRATQVLFVQVLQQSLLPGGRCGVVLDEGFLYRTNEDAFVRTKRKLLDENDLWCIVSLPGGAFTGAGAGVKTNLVFFALGLRERAKVERKSDRDAQAEALLGEASEAERAAREASAKAHGIEDAIYDLKAVNPKERKASDTRTPVQLLDAIEFKGREADDALARLRLLMSG